MSGKYGNDVFWCFPDDVPIGRSVAIWKRTSEREEIIAHGDDFYEAKFIVDALIFYHNNNPQFGLLKKKELAFLDFLKAHAPEPYATMASNTIMWNDRETYNKLLADFPVLYSDELYSNKGSR